MIKWFMKSKSSVIFLKVALLEVTQIGKECHNDCAIKKAAGECVMPTEGLFAIVVREGAVRAGDSIRILEEEVP